MGLTLDDVYREGVNGAERRFAVPWRSVGGRGMAGERAECYAVNLMPQERIENEKLFPSVLIVQASSHSMVNICPYKVSRQPRSGQAM